MKTTLNLRPGWRKRLKDWFIDFFIGRPVTKEDILEDRKRICAAAGLDPDDVVNFWEGIEELKPERPSEPDIPSDFSGYEK